MLVIVIASVPDEIYVTTMRTLSDILLVDFKRALVCIGRYISSDAHTAKSNHVLSVASSSGNSSVTLFTTPQVFVMKFLHPGGPRDFVSMQPRYRGV